MVVRESVGRDLMRLVVWYPLRWLVLAVPVNAGIAILRAMGDIHYALGRGMGGLLRRNLALMKGEDFANGPAGAECAREYLRIHYLDRLFIFIFPKMGREKVEELVEFDGLSRLDEALAEGRGAILVHGHFGPAHLPLVALARMGYPMKQVGFPSDEGLSWIGKNVAFRLRLEYEAKMPAEVLMADAYMRPVFRHLRSNGVLMITGDGSGTDKRIGQQKEHTFHGRRAFFPIGPAAVAAKTGAALLPMFITPGRKKPFRVVIEERVKTDGEDDAALYAASREFIRLLERYTGEYPAYMRFLDRFRPGGVIEE